MAPNTRCQFRSGKPPSVIQFVAGGCPDIMPIGTMASAMIAVIEKAATIQRPVLWLCGTRACRGRSTAARNTIAVAPLNARVTGPKIDGPRENIQPTTESAVSKASVKAKTSAVRYHCKTGVVVRRTICAEGRNLSHAISRRTNAARARKAAARVVIAPARLKTPEIGSARFDVSQASSHSPTDALAIAAEPAYTARATDSHRNPPAIPARTTPNVGVWYQIEGTGAESINMVESMYVVPRISKFWDPPNIRGLGFRPSSKSLRRTRVFQGESGPRVDGKGLIVSPLWRGAFDDPGREMYLRANP